MMDLFAGRSVVVMGEDPDQSEQMATYLAAHGFLTQTCTDPKAFLSQMPQAEPSLVLLQSLAKRSRLAIELVRQIRNVSTVPCILRARDPDEDSDRVLGLESGIDDWISSVTTPREVLARVRAVLRRTMRQPPISSPLVAPLPHKALEVVAPGTWRLSPERRELFTPSGAPCGLTSAEFDMFHVLSRKRGVAVTRDALSLAVFRRPWFPDDRAIDNVAARLRRKLTPHSHNPELIKPVRGVGYVFTSF